MPMNVTMNATGGAVMGVDVPPALILSRVDTTEDDSLDHDEKVVMEILRWFTDNGQSNIPLTELDIAYNIVNMYEAMLLVEPTNAAAA